MKISMKKYLKMLALVAFFGSLNACTKFVDYNPQEEFKTTDQDYLKSESDYRTMEISCYTPLQWINQVVPIGDIATDNSVAGGESAFIALKPDIPICVTGASVPPVIE